MGTGPRTTIVVAISLLAASSAGAAEYEVTGDVAAQGYDVVSPWGDVVIGRRRLTSTLGLAVFDIEGDDHPFAADYSVQLRMRLDADFGIEGAEERYDPATAGLFSPGLDRTPVDLMFGFIEGKNLGDGWFGFRVGRQYLTDALGWWSFDGAMLRLTTPYFVQAEVYGGLEQRGGLPLSTSRFERQGVWRGAHGDFAARAQDYPSYQFASVAPAFGAALESTGVNWLHGRVSYRRVYNTGTAFTSQFPAAGVPNGGHETVEGLRISSEQFGYAASAFLADVGALRGGFAYDLYSERFNRGFAAIEGWPVPNALSLGAEFDYFVPTFDADSIWNWFTHNEIITALGRVAAGPFSGFDVSVSAGARLWRADGDPAGWARAQCSVATGGDPRATDLCLSFGIDPTNGTFSREEANREAHLAPDLMADAGSRYDWGSGRVALRGMLETGFGGASTNRGRRGGGDLSATQGVLGRTVWLGGRVSVYHWDDPLRPDRSATSFGYVLAPEYVPWDYTRFRVEWEHDVNRLVGQRFRILGLVKLWVIP
jgi:hypothetical protein